MHPNCTNRRKHKFRVQWGGSGAFVAKNSDATFVRQPNGLKCTQIVQNAPNHQFMVQWGGSGAFGAKYSDKTSFSNFCTSSACFAPRFVWQPNVSKCTQIVRIAENISLGSNGVDRMRSLRKIPLRLRGRNFCTSSPRFASSFVRQPNSAECTQIVRNAPKCQFRVQ